MKSNRLSILLAALLALVTGALVLAYTLGADNRALQGATSSEAYVTTGTLPVGESLKDALDAGLIKLQAFPSSAIPETAVSKVDDTNGSLVATSALAEGQLVLTSYFDSANSLAHGLQVPDGQVALTLNLEDSAHVGSFLTPGSEVVLYDTFQVNLGATVIEKTGVLLPKVLVLAVGNSVTPSNQDSKSSALVTIAVTPAESVHVVQAAQTGKVYFALLGSKADLGNIEIITPENLFKQQDVVK